MYLRTTTPGVKVSAGVFTGDEVWQPDQEFIPTEEWQRFVVSGRRHGKSVMRSLNLQLKGVGVVWIAAPQLEFGLTASEYQPAAADGNMDSSSEPADVPRIVLSGAGQAPVIDGKLDDPVWKDSEELTGFQTNTMPPMAAAVQTVARIAGDEENLYLAFQCTEPEMARLRANAETDDQSAIFEDDSVEIFLSTEHDGSNYYQFVVNSRGVRLDSCNQNNSWNAQWQAAAARGDGFWSVEVKIPVAELNRFRRDGVWRINLCRNRYVSGSAECSSYSPVNGASFHAPGRFAFLSGLPFRQETHSASAVAKVQLPPFQVISEFDYYTDDENATAVVDSTAVKSANGAELQLEVVASGTGETLWKEKFPLPGAFNTRIPFPVKDLPVGEYRLKATALLPDGNAAAVSEDSFRKLPPAPVTQVRTNRAARCLEIDGEPFFGFGSILVYYWLKYATGTAGEPYWQLDDIRSHSQNSMWVGDMGVQSYDERYVEYEDFLDGCAKRGLKVIFNVQSFPAPESAAFRDGIIRFVNRFKGHPAVIAWNYVDEPELWWDSVPGRREADLRMIYEAIKEADPYRPAFINWCHFSDQPYGTLAAGDVVSVDRYPLRYEMLTFKPGIVLDIAAELNRVSRRERKVSMQFLQLQGFWDMSREPSIAELRQMSYGSFLHGTRIIQYLIYRCMSNDLWASVGQLGAELNTLGEFVTAPGARELLVADGEELNWALWRNEDGYLLIYLNSSTEAISTRLNWKEMTSTSLKSAEVLFDGSGVRRNGDELEFNLAPLACGAVAIEAGE